jgi:DNA-directed RNA polymerase
MALDAFEQAVRARPVMFPSPETPIPWSGLYMGGPVDAAGHHTTAVLRTYHKETIALVKDAVKRGQMKPTLDALNAIQAVPWTINKRVLAVIEECARLGLVVKGGAKGWGVPPKESFPIPQETEDMTDLERGQCRLEANRARKANHMLLGERLSFKADLTTAQELSAYERFHVPHNLDWRGRVYGLSHFNFQRDDRVRACFLFADGEEIGEEGLRWLKIHTANCGDFGKVSKRPYEERVKWTEDNAAVIQAIAANPLVELLWLEADKPFLFLSACMEMASALQEGPRFVTRLPVSWDGSCSGLQHLCAMTRAPEGALVNLTPSEEPQDVYTLVADATFAAIEQDVDDEKLGKFARMALAYDGNRRKLVKRNVMTYSYSSKKFGMSQQLIEDLMEPLAIEVQSGRREEHPFSDNESTQAAAARYLASKIYAAIETVVDRPAQAMAFLQKIARALAHEGKVLEWITPTGLPWSNRYHTPTTKRVRLWMHDRGVKVDMMVATGYEKAVDKDRAANGVAPNLVHACDAAHLMMVVNAAVAEGITGHALVHDSFGCLASRAGRYHQIIREQFVRLYTEHDVLAEVLERAKCALSEHNRNRLPDRVEPGDLNINAVLEAPYAFA